MDLSSTILGSLSKLIHMQVKQYNLAKTKMYCVQKNQNNYNRLLYLKYDQALFTYLDAILWTVIIPIIFEKEPIISSINTKNFTKLTHMSPFKYELKLKLWV